MKIIYSDKNGMKRDETMNEVINDWFNPDVSTFGDRLAAARDAAGLDQRGFAVRLGVKPSTVQKWEDDLAEPRANRLSMMAGLLGVSMTWLINGQGEGVDAPEEIDMSGLDVQDILIELRELRAVLSAKSEQAGRLEKRLRSLMAGVPSDAEH